MTLDQIVQDIKSEFPDFKTVPKSGSCFMKFLNVLLKIISFGRYSDFMDYYTTIGNTIYTPDHWEQDPESDRIVILRHERVHMRQRRTYGSALFFFLYLIPFFPVCFAYWRRKFEMEAYEESMRAEVELHGPKSVLSSDYREQMIQQFTGPAYLWCWPFRKSVTKWCLDSAEKAVATYGIPQGK